MMIHKSVSTIKDMMIIIYISSVIYRDNGNEKLDNKKIKVNAL